MHHYIISNIRIILIIFLGICSLVASNLYSHRLGQNASKLTINQLDSVTRTDYPLIEYYFDEQEKWVLINRVDMFGKDYCEVLQDNQVLREMRKEYQLTTFPVGSGTTPTGSIYLYRDGSLVKQIPYLTYSISIDYFANRFTRMQVDNAEKIIKQKLPPRI